MPVIPRSAYDLVYEPREDSFLFLSALEAEREHLTQLRPLICVEIGPGSGIVSTFVSSLLPQLPMQFFGCDINPDAARISMQTFEANRHARPHVMQCCVSDLSSCFGSRLDGKVDLLLFNPPYVPTGEEEVGHADIRAAWAGGADGMQVTERFLPEIARLLSPSGCCYMVLVQENDPLGLAKRVAEVHRLMPKQIAKKKAKNERLSVWRYSRRRMKQSNCV